MRALPRQAKSFKTNAEPAAEEVFRVETAAPGVVAAEKLIVLTENAEVISDFDLGPIALRSGEGVGSPHAHVEFVVTVELFTGRDDRLFHFFAGRIGGGTGKACRCQSD